MGRPFPSPLAHERKLFDDSLTLDLKLRPFSTVGANWNSVAGRLGRETAGKDLELGLFRGEPLGRTDRTISSWAQAAGLTKKVVQNLSQEHVEDVRFGIDKRPYLVARNKTVRRSSKPG